MDQNRVCVKPACRDKQCELENIIKTLSSHSLKLIEKHEELLENYQKNQDQYQKLRDRFLEKGDQIKQARQVLGPISLELKQLREKYNLALTCQVEAEHFATKINHENKNLKRQSQMLLQNLGNVNITEINIEDDEPDTKDAEEYLDSLRQKISSLESEKVDLSEQIKEVKEDLIISEEKRSQDKAMMDSLKTELLLSNTNVKRQEKTLTLLAKTSEAAFEEHDKLQENFEKEIQTRCAAEKFAEKMFKGQVLANRQSAMLLKDIGPNQKLMEAMLEIQKLNEDAIKKNAEYKDTTTNLEKELESCKRDVFVCKMEKEKMELEDQHEAVMKNLSFAEDEIKLLKKENTSLLGKYAELEKKMENATRIPPPPPPPPLPPISAPKRIMDILGGRRKKREQTEKHLKGAGANVNTDYSKAVDEMMVRIKSGKSGLRSIAVTTNSLPKEEEGKAMKELQGLLTKMKKSRSDEDLLGDDVSSLDKTSELGQIFQRRKDAAADKGKTVNVPSPVNLPPPVRVPPPITPRRKPSVIPEEEEN